MFPFSLHFTCKTVATIRHLPSMTLCRNGSVLINITSRNTHCSARPMPIRIPLLFRSSNRLGMRSISQEYKERTPDSEKDLLLFRYEDQRTFTWMNLCGISMFFFSTFIGTELFAMSDTSDNTPRSSLKETLPWYARFNILSSQFRIWMGSALIGIGCIFLCGTVALSLRSVRYLILHKGRERVSIVTYGVLGRNRTEEFALKDVSCQGSRTTELKNLPIKVRGRFLFYLLPSKGEYRNLMLFDKTVGCNRGF